VSLPGVGGIIGGKAGRQDCTSICPGAAGNGSVDELNVRIHQVEDLNHSLQAVRLTRSDPPRKDLNLARTAGRFGRSRGFGSGLGCGRGFGHGLGCGGRLGHGLAGGASVITSVAAGATVAAGASVAAAGAQAERIVVSHQRTERSKPWIFDIFFY
jgi:hypothetical protein